MTFYSILLPAIAILFVLAWAYVAWIKFREHRHILRDEHHHHHKSHVTFMGRVLPGNRRR